MIRRRDFRFTCLLLACLPLTAVAQVYSWKDANGKTHYGDRPPATKLIETRKLSAAPPVDVEANRKALAEQQLADREKQQKAQAKAKETQQEQADNQARAANCNEARANLVAIESGAVRYALDPQGGRIALDGAAREAELAKARKSISDWCSPPKSAQ